MFKVFDNDPYFFGFKKNLIQAFLDMDLDLKVKE
jgi:hypothetical protein